MIISILTVNTILYAKWTLQVEIVVKQENKVDTPTVFLPDAEMVKNMLLTSLDRSEMLNGEAQAIRIPTTSKLIKIKIELPDYLKPISSINRVFKVIRVHNDGDRVEVDTLMDIDTDPNTITIETDRFSTYAIVYKDIVSSDLGVKDHVPQTTDKNTSIVGLGLLSIMSGVGVIYFKKKRKSLK